MNYYKICQTDSNTWYISEPLGVGCFLFAGAEKALLLDTCNGFRDVRKTVSKLTDKPLIILNSHGHADHAGGNGQFPQVYIHEKDLFMTKAVWQKNQRDLLFGYARTHYPLMRPLLWWLERSRPQFHDTEYITIKDGASFDLGGRKLVVIHCPGHSPGSIILADTASKTLYVGDAVNNALFLFFEQSPKIKEYAERLRKLSELKGFDRIHGSHAKKLLPFSFIRYYADFLERGTLEKSIKTDIPNEGKDVYVYEENGEAFGLDKIAVHFTKELI